MIWHDVASSEALPVSGILIVEIDGAELVVWRSASGETAVCDARCPHQWAHLGSAGVVDGEELVCLSHFWRFDVEGGGSKVAMNGRRDPKGPIGTHRVREVAGRIEVAMTPR